MNASIERKPKNPAVRFLGTTVVAVALLSALAPIAALPAAVPHPAQVPQMEPPAPPALVPRNGVHDFDWDIGTWATHQRRRLHPLTGSNQWVEYRGTDVVRRIWNGANSGIIEADGPAGHLEIYTLRLYDPNAHQWSIFFVTAGGSMSKPAIGEFVNGTADFYDQEEYQGRAILLRFSISGITPNSCHFEQAFSADGGKSWEVNFIVDEVRVQS